MNTTTEVGGTSFGTAELRMGRELGTRTGALQNGETSSFDGNSDKISLVELDRALDIIGDRGKTKLMNYIQFYNRKATNDGFVKLGIVHDLLHEFFGDAAVLLMREIRQ
jgi:hypothetical protein